MQRELLFLLNCKKATILALFAVMLMVSWSSGDVFGQFQITYPKQAKSLSTCQGADSLFGAETCEVPKMIRRSRKFFLEFRKSHVGRWYRPDGRYRRSI